MENKITIDIKSDRDPQIKITKDEAFTPKTPEEAKEMLNNDLVSLVETTLVLLDLGATNGYIDREVYLDGIIKKFTDAKK